MCSVSDLKLIFYLDTLCSTYFTLSESPGVDLASLQTRISGVFFGFQISRICIFWVVITAVVVFGLSNKCCVF